jgi:type II secretion system protein G
VRQRFNALRRNQNGFTLIELLIVIVILGILTGVVVFAVDGIQNRGEAAACKSNLSTVQVAVEAYRAKNTSYPTTLSQLTASPNKFLANAPAGVSLASDGSGTVTANPAC